VAAGVTGDERSELDVLVSRADLDGLVRMVDALTEGRGWAGLLRLRDRCRSAVSTGRQLWPAATLAEYRLALHADAPWAAAVLDESSGRFTIGPLTEVVAQHHTFAELRPHLPAGPRAAFVAHERAVRGEEIDPAGLLPVLEVPFEGQVWEPDYLVATYSDEGVVQDPPAAPAADVVELPLGAEVIDDDQVELAVRQLLEPWTASSNGRAEVVCVEGDALDAVGALGPRRARVAEIDASEALRWLAWAGGTGGAMARRRGAALGRFGAWWTVATIADALVDGALRPDPLAEALARLRWCWWHPDEPAGGWELHLAVHDPHEGYAWAIAARDAI